MDLLKEILKGNKVALAKGITFSESSLETDILDSQKLITDCFPYSGNSIRIGITGVPGVGKSTFIETFGKILTEKGKKVGNIHNLSSITLYVRKHITCHFSPIIEVEIIFAVKN